MRLVLLKFSLIILFYIVDDLIFHVTKRPTQIQLLEIIVAALTIGSVIQESNLSKNCLESHETKIQANSARLFPWVENCVASADRESRQVGSLGPEKVEERPQSFCHRPHLVSGGGGGGGGREKKLYVRGIMRCTEKNKMTTTWAESACGRMKYGYGFH